VATFIFVIFFLGYSQSNTTFLGIVSALPGQYWQNFLQNSLGQPIAIGLAEKSPWLLARVGGIISYGLLSTSVILGLCTSLHLTDRFLHRAKVVHLHKILSLSTLAFVILHVIGLLLDSYIKISLVESLIPFSTKYQPFWTGIGTLSLYGIIAVVISFYLASRLGYKIWRVVHYLSFALFASSFLHGILIGSDSRSLWMQLIYLTTGFSVIFLTGIRFTSATPRFRK
jgi:sulfoxide reductase heme-binding subunit YedZ